MVHQEYNQPTFEDLEILAEVSQLLTLVDLNRVMQKVIALASRAVGAQKTSLFLLEGEQVDWEHIITMRDMPQDQSVKVVSRVLGEGFAGWVFRNRRGDIINDTTKDARWIVFPDDPVETRSAMCVPFVHHDQVIAMVTLIHAEPDHFHPYHLRLMEIIANQATIAIRNAQLVNHLRDQRRQLRAVLQSITDVLLVLDPQGRIVIVNDAAITMLDVRSQDDALGQLLSEFVLVDNVFEPIAQIVHDNHSDQALWSFETRSERRQIDFQVRMSIWEDSSHERLGYVVVMHNVTTLHDLSRFKDEMLRVASHDLRSPLALVAGYADLIKMDTPDPDSPLHEYVEIIKTSVDKMGTLVEDLLRVERIRSSPLELQEQTDLAALVKIVLVNSKMVAKAKNQLFETDIHMEGCPKILADGVLLRQAMENLIINAIKYTPQGGTIQVSAYYTEDKYHFIVEDNGIGIPEAQQQFVFESFYRVDNARMIEKGSGLGLSLVKNVIARHNGEIWLKSEVDKGSRFGFWLPLRPREDEVSNAKAVSGY